MDVMERRRAAEALRAIKRGGEGWYSLRRDAGCLAPEMIGAAMEYRKVMAVV